MKKIIIEIPDEWHSKIKARCALRKRSIKSWVFEAIVKLTRAEDEKELLIERSKTITTNR